MPCGRLSLALGLERHPATDAVPRDLWIEARTTFANRRVLCAASAAVLDTAFRGHELQMTGWASPGSSSQMLLRASDAAVPRGRVCPRLKQSVALRAFPGLDRRTTAEG